MSTYIIFLGYTSFCLLILGGFWIYRAGKKMNLSDLVKAGIVFVLLGIMSLGFFAYNHYKIEIEPRSEARSALEKAMQELEEALDQ